MQQRDMRPPQTNESERGKTQDLQFTALKNYVKYFGEFLSEDL